MKILKLIVFIAIVIASIPSRSVTYVYAQEPTNIQKIKKIAIQNGIDQYDLLGIALRESSLCKALTGDGGISKGCFHANLRDNPEAKSLIGDVEKEAQWVADKLISYGYKDGFRTLSFARYNRPARPNYEYAEKVKIDVETVKKMF